ncbi:type II toxin-antitoxin system HicB family antitoxin [bacterium]|nr:type II toxin-antitoxin system HicB family antitoxin [bacterium]
MTDKTLSYKVVLEEHKDGFVAYPLGLVKGVVVGDGQTKEKALANLQSALGFHLETFGPDELVAHPAEVKTSLEDATISV